MKLTTYTADGRTSYGIVTDAGIVDLGARFPEAPTLRDFLATGGVARAGELASTEADVALDAVTFEPVIPNPDKIICVGLNYHDHVVETGRTVTENPVLFARYAGSQIGHGQALVKPLESDDFDYEGELAVIIGTAGRRIAEKDALDHVAGYACYNDGSVRDWQRHTSQFMPGKTFAGTGAFGPWMVTADEIPDPTALKLITRLNGQVVQETTLDLMITSVERLVAYCSTILPLEPGDVIVSGTPGGVGAKRTPPLWMRAGDVCEVEITGIGTLSNPVADEAALAGNAPAAAATVGA
jgi:2-keto-4-pentenoate hydratase/2-oxohepta-3-ene-1,7-dioic acid hydratase in catechol pathway